MDWLPLRPRLQTVLELTGHCDVMADIGCDHGKLALAMLQRGHAERVIAADISRDSVEKAKSLAVRKKVEERMDVRLGDGLQVLEVNEARTVVIAGMGGTLMARLLDACTVPLMGAERIVLQPMRAQADIRQYLFDNGYPIQCERIVRDAGRLYQVFVALAPRKEKQELPDGWPEHCFEVGFGALDDPLMKQLVTQMLNQHEKRLLTARGTRGAQRLEERTQNMRTILDLIEGRKL